ncbi:MAG: TolC family protein [Chlorobiaceae bacterium]|nr:TolC family protein [Chlorobiaceae bacterium]
MNNQQHHGMKCLISSAPLSLLFLSLAVLPSCSPVMEYRRPEVQLPAAYPGQANEGKELAAVPYKQFFTDPDLLELIDSAVANNQDLMVALKNIDYAGKSLDVAQLWFLPEVNAGATVNYSRASRNSSTASKGQERTSRSYTAALTASWEADIWAKLQNAKKAALAEYLRSTDAARAVRTSLVASVAQGYWNLRMLDEQIDITKRNIALGETTLAMIRLQFEAGNVTSLAVQQQESQLLSTRLVLPRLEASRTAQENALSILAGRVPGTPIKRSRSAAAFVMPGSFGAGVPINLLSNRPDVRAAEASLMEAHAMTGVTKAMMYPTLMVTAQGGVNAIESSKWFSMPGSLFDFLQASVVQPVFRHGQLNAQYDQSLIRSEQAELTFRQSLLKAVGEVSNALEQVDKSGKQEQIALDRVVALRKGSENARLLFKSGMATWLEVITVDSSLLQSELELADVQRSRLAAVAELYRSVGGGWKE